MGINHILLAIQACNQGLVVFNQGNIRAFLYKNKWYPLRAIVNHAAQLAGEDNNLTTDQGLVRMVYLNMWLRVCDIDFNDNHPVEVNQNLIASEVRNLSNILYHLTNT